MLRRIETREKQVLPNCYESCKQDLMDTWDFIFRLQNEFGLLLLLFFIFVLNYITLHYQGDKILLCINNNDDIIAVILKLQLFNC